MELTLSLPRDVRLAAAAGSLVVHAARQAGYDPPAAEALGKAVEARVRESLDVRGGADRVPVVIRHEDGPLEVLVNGCFVSITA